MQMLVPQKKWTTTVNDVEAMADYITKTDVLKPGKLTWHAEGFEVPITKLGVPKT